MRFPLGFVAAMAVVIGFFAPGPAGRAAPATTATRGASATHDTPVAPAGRRSAGAGADAGAGAGVRPNVLWISAEDLSPDLGCYGVEGAITPNLDRLAAQGARFDRAFATAPVCSPSRSSIITGMYASSIGTHHHRSDVVPPAYVRCFSEWLRAAGYFCTNNAKTDYNFPPPLSAWDENGRRAHWKHRAAGQPFFAVFNFHETHESRAMDLNGQYAGLTDELAPAERHDPAKLKLPPYYPDTPAVRANWARWFDLVTLTDKRIQSLLDELERDGLADETIVIFWGDHGRALPRGKRFAYDSGLRVPLIVRWPGKIEPGSVRDDLVSLVDLAPTMLSLAGLEPPAHLQGRIFLGDKVEPAPATLLATRDRMDETHDMIRSVRSPRYRYIRNFHPELPYAQRIGYMDQSPLMKEWRRLATAGELRGPPALFFSKSKPAEELYDTQADPHEVRNLATSPQHQAVLRTMREELVEWMERIDDQGTSPEPADALTPRADRVRPTTAAPVPSVSARGRERGREVTLGRLTPGSSIAYTIDGTDRDERRWRLYVKPIELPPGVTLRAKACRIGFADSDTVEVAADAAAPAGDRSTTVPAEQVSD